MSYTIIFQGFKADESVSREEFVEHWLTKHKDLNIKLPKLRSYEVLIVNGVSEDASEPLPMGFAILRYDSKEDFEAAMKSPAAKESFKDNTGVFRHTRAYYTVDTHQFIGSPPLP